MHTNGYTEPQSQTDARAFKIAMASKGYDKTHNTEAEVDRVRDLIDCAELNDLNPVDAAQSIEQAIDATLHAEDFDSTPTPSDMPVINFDDVQEEEY